MKALTLSRPWPFAITLHGKRIENRKWAPPKAAIGSRIALHSAKSFDIEGAKYIETVIKSDVRVPNKSGRYLVPCWAERWGFVDVNEPGRIFATCVIDGWFRADDFGTAIFTPQVSVEQFARWGFGPICWILSDFRLVKGPVLKGALGLWECGWSQPQ